MTQELKENSQETKTSKLAIASLISGILSIFVVTALAAVIFGIISLVKIKNSAGALKGKGMAIAGIILGSLFIIILPVTLTFIGLAFPAFNSIQERAEQTMSSNNARTVFSALNLYAFDHDNQFPDKLEDISEGEVVYLPQSSYQSIFTKDGRKEGNWIYFNSLSMKSPSSYILMLGPEIRGKRAVLKIDGSVSTQELPGGAQGVIELQGGTYEVIEWR